MAAESALSATFISDEDAWALADEANAAVVLQTTTRGQHWSQVGVVPAAPNDTGVTQIRFADAKDGWAFGPVLYATHDGGATWDAVSLPGDVLSLEAADGIVWVVVGGCLGAVPCSPPSSLYRASAASDVWQPVPGISLSSGGQLALHGTAVYVFSSTILFSSDGTSFSFRPYPCSGGPSAIASADSVAVLCVSGQGAGSSTKEIFVSSDAAQTFHQ